MALTMMIFSPVFRFSSIRFLLAFAVQHDFLIHQMDVETAFLNGKLEEEIYMQQPEGYRKEDTLTIIAIHFDDLMILAENILDMQ